MTHSKLAVLALVGALAVGAEAQQQSITGDWTFTVEHIGLKLSLEEKNSAVTGTLDWPHGDPVTLTGLFANETLILSGDSAGENFTIHIDVTGRRKADGTLAGTVKAHFDEFNDAHIIARVRNQNIPWTAARGLKDIVHFPR